MVDLTIKIDEFRKRIYEDEVWQDFIENILMMANEERLKRALYTIVYTLMGGKIFPFALREKIIYCMNQGIIEKTFLDKHNYEQRVYGMFAVKNGKTKEFEDIYYRDVLINLGQGIQAKKNGRGLSVKRQIFLKEEVSQYSIIKMLDIIVEQFSSDELENKYEEICNARKKLVILSEHFSVEDFIMLEDEKEDELVIEQDVGLSETEKSTLILARRGQGKFRAEVLKRNESCPFTGINDPKLLVASHIKPWRSSNNKERIDGNNGFALTPTYDRLFDQGFISFDDNKRLLISSELDENIILALGLQKGMIVERLVLSDMCKKYLSFHREERFKK